MDDFNKDFNEEQDLQEIETSDFDDNVVEDEAVAKGECAAHSEDINAEDATDNSADFFTEENYENPDYFEGSSIEDYTAPTNEVYNQSYVPDFSYAEPRPERVKNKGLKVFTLILSAVLVIALSVSAGYFAAVYNGATGSIAGSVSVPSLELENRPDNDSEIFNDYSETFSHVNESVVNILVYNPNGSSTGSASGVIYSNDGYIVTNDHIYESIPNAKFLVRLHNGKEYKASFVAGDVRSDLAVIKIDDKVSNLKVAKFGDSSDVLVGEQVITVGYPSSYGDSATLTHGIISATDRRVTSTTTSYASSFLQTDAAINPGNSGGALANMYGQVVGITSSKLAGDVYDAVSYAIPTVTMKKVVTSLIKDGCVTDRAKLGITYTEVNTLAAEANDIPVGVYIGTISSDSDLSGKGFKEGDVITHVNDIKITNSDILLKVIENAKAGDSIKLTIFRTGTQKSKNVSVKLLADKGSSSYSKKESTQSNDGSFNFEDIPNFGENNGNSSKDDKDSNSSKAFDFPLN